MKSWLYARVSTAKNTCRKCDKKFLSADDMPVCPECNSVDVQKSQDTQNQLRILRNWMKEQGHEITAEYVDRASGKSGDRDQFKKMFVDLEKRRPKNPVLIGFWSLDRLSREGVLETLQYLQKFSQLKAEWKSYTEQFLDSTGIFKEAIIAIFAALAKQQRVRIRENTIAGMERAAINGTRSGKPIGRPNEIDVRVAKELYERTKSWRAVGEAIGVSGHAAKWAVLGRPEPRPAAIVWSAPARGTIENGEFVEQDGGDIVVRYDMETSIAYCINHQGRIDECLVMHIGGLKQ